MATRADSAPADRPDAQEGAAHGARTVPVGSPDSRSFNYVLGVGVATFAVFAILFLIIDAVNGNL